MQVEGIVIVDRLQQSILLTAKLLSAGVTYQLTHAEVDDRKSLVIVNREETILVRHASAELTIALLVGNAERCIDSAKRLVRMLAVHFEDTKTHTLDMRAVHSLFVELLSRFQRTDRLFDNLGSPKLGHTQYIDCAMKAGEEPCAIVDDFRIVKQTDPPIVLGCSGSRLTISIKEGLRADVAVTIHGCACNAATLDPPTLAHSVSFSKDVLVWRLMVSCGGVYALDGVRQFSHADIEFECVDSESSLMLRSGDLYRLHRE